MSSLIEPLYNQLGFVEKESDEHLDVFLRRLAVNWACKLGNSECIDKVTKQFNEWMSELEPDSPDANPVNVNMKGSVYCHAIKNGDENEWNFAWTRYNKSNVASEKRNLLNAMSCTKEIWLLRDYLNRSLRSESGVRKQDGSYVISYIAKNIVGRDLAFDFVKENWDTVISYYGKSSFSFAGVIRNIMSDRNTEYELNELKSFVEKYGDEFGSATRAAKQAIEKTTANLNWMNKNYQIIYRWLQAINKV